MFRSIRNDDDLTNVIMFIIQHGDNMELGVPYSLEHFNLSPIILVTNSPNFACFVGGKEFVISMGFEIETLSKISDFWDEVSLIPCKSLLMETHKLI